MIRAQPDGLEAAATELRVGGRWQFDYGENEGRRDVLRGEYLVVDIGWRLVFSWIHERTLGDGRVETSPESKVTITFDPLGEGSFIRLVHERIVREQGQPDVAEG